jgi:colanic acid/amylovoran biosynthesis glycosyltransferase
LEAMAASLPVVSTRHSGVPSLVDDGRTGRLVAPQDAAGLAGALAELATDGSRRVGMGAAGRNRFERQFTISSHIERMRRVFLEVGGAPAIEPARQVADAFAAL